MANSVLDSLDSRDEINEVKILISGERTLGRFTVRVEGIEDVKVYEKFVLKEKVIVKLMVYLVTFHIIYLLKIKMIH